MRPIKYKLRTLPKIINFPITQIFRHIQNKKKPHQKLHISPLEYFQSYSQHKAAIFFSLQWPMKAWLFTEETLLSPQVHILGYRFALLLTIEEN